MADVQIDEQRLEAFMGGMVGHLTGAVTVSCAILGHQVGYYKAMAHRGPMSADEVAAAAGANPRVTREWLDQQASVAIVDYDVAADTYELGPEAALALAEEHSPVFMAGGLEGFRALAIDIDKLTAAYKGDGGMGWGEHHECLFSGTSEFFRPAYEHHLVQDWLPALRDGVGNLEAGIAVADVGCGGAISTTQMAAAFPNSSFTGFDYHQPSIESARARSAGMKLSNTSYEALGAKEFAGSFDLVCFFDCLHDMGDPVGIAEHTRSQLNEGGSVMVVEPFAFDSRTENYAALGGLMYGASAMICTPCSLSQEVGRGMGAQSGEAQMRAVFEEAGYGSFERATETPFNIVYQAHP